MERGGNFRREREGLLINAIARSSEMGRNLPVWWQKAISMGKNETSSDIPVNQETNLQRSLGDSEKSSI